jgi:pentose-5-phosphate-3-epimerase
VSGFLAPSLLSADHAHLADAVACVQEHAGALHLALPGSRRHKNVIPGNPR